MSKYNTLKVYELTLLQFDVDYWPSISDDNNFGILVSLLDCEAWNGDRFRASIYTLGKTDDRIFLSKVNFNEPRILKISNHIIINVFGRPVEVTMLPLLEQFFDVLVESLYKTHDVKNLKIDFRTLTSALIL